MKDLGFKEDNVPTPLLWNNTCLELDEEDNESYKSKYLNPVKESNLEPKVKKAVLKKINKDFEEITSIHQRIEKLSTINLKDLAGATYQIIIQIKECNYNINNSKGDIGGIEVITSFSLEEYKTFKSKVREKDFEYFNTVFFNNLKDKDKYSYFDIRYIEKLSFTFSTSICLLN